MRFRVPIVVVLLLSALLLQSMISAESAKFSIAQQVRPLPGTLDEIPVLNSNSPEVVRTEGILLSTFPPDGKATAKAHLNAPLQGRFDLFFHHIANGIKADDRRTLWIACLLGNAGSNKVTVKTLQAASYLSRPDAPFMALPEVAANKHGKIYAGPGDRVTLDFLQGRHSHGWADKVTLRPGEEKLLFARPIPVRKLDQPLNGRSGLMKLVSDGPVYAAMLALYARDSDNDHEGHEPKLADWQALLKDGSLAGPRDVTPSAPGAAGHIVYGRVAGIARGTIWKCDITGGANQTTLPIAPGQVISYPLSTVAGGTMGTDQVQSAPMVVRYPDTAYEAHGNYGILYDLTLPITNASDQPAKVSVTLQSPIKNASTASQLTFYETPPEHVFFRGSVRFQFIDDSGKHQDQYIHLVEKQGVQMPPLVTLTLGPHEIRAVEVSFLYPPDATPPQVLTLSSSSKTP
jgi:hypothetical protein